MIGSFCWSSGEPSRTKADPGGPEQRGTKFTRGPSAVNKPVITAVDPDRLISWARTEPFGGSVEWTYRFWPNGGGTLVTESYQVTRSVSRIGAMARRDRRNQLHGQMEQTLLRIRAALESRLQRTQPPLLLG
jgi:hypothetical protein